MISEMITRIGDFLIAHKGIAIIVNFFVKHASVILGAGRTNKDDTIDYSAGIILEKKTGDKVICGDVIAYLHTNDKKAIEAACKVFSDGIIITGNAPEKTPLIYKVIK